MRYINYRTYWDAVKMIVEILIFIITFLVTYIFWRQKKIHDFLRAKGVKFVPGYPLYGNTYGSMSDTKHIVQEIIDVYNTFPEERYVGFMEGSKPAFLIRDPEIIRKITIKHFEHFVDHKDFFPSRAGIFANNVFVMRDETWREMRTTLSPAFTGSKMRAMMPCMEDVSFNTVKYLKENQGKIIDVDDLMRRYTVDVIASAGYGLKIDSFVDMENEFYKVGMKIFDFDQLQKLKFFLFFTFPYFTQKFGVKLFPEKTVAFFKDIISSAIEERKKNNIERPDMIQLLMDAPKKWSIEVIVGQVFIFFTGGFETAASTLVLCTHELAVNPEAQEKLFQEVHAFSQKKKLTFENLPELKYLECVVNETLRKWCPGLVMDRICVKPYDLPPPREGGKPTRLNPGDMVYNVINAIHMDPKHFPDPDTFIPERFLDENKHKIAPFTFLPFGLGPRTCLASRFAALELKVLVYHLIKNFKIATCEKTAFPIRLLQKGFMIKATGGTFVKFESRD